MDLVLISNGIVVSLPFIVALAAYLFRLIVSKMPEAQRIALTHLAQDAVQFVEMVYTNAPSEQKKAQALKALKDLFEEFHLPVPGDSVLITAIESAVWMIQDRGKENPTAFSMPAVKK